jgi:hypothetical protein
LLQSSAPGTIIREISFQKNKSAPFSCRVLILQVSRIIYLALVRQECQQGILARRVLVLGGFMLAGKAQHKVCLVKHYKPRKE